MSARVVDADVVRGVALDSDPSVIQIEVEASSYFSRPPEEMGRGRIPNTQGNIRLDVLRTDFNQIYKLLDFIDWYLNSSFTLSVSLQ